MRRVFLTGGTGFLGSYLAYLLIEKGFHVTLLVRGSKNLPGKAKFRHVLKTLIPDADMSLVKKQTEFVVGHLKDENLGIKHSEAGWGWDVLIHCAAGTNFYETDDDSLRLSNVKGTQYVLRFAKKFQIPSFHYVSTAYSCGDVKGRVKEKIHNPSSFRNDYEKTKSQAERICFSFCAENNIKLTTHRPSIVVGDSETGRTVNFEGPYLFFKQMVRFVHYMQRRQRLKSNEKVHINIQLPAYSEDEQNIVPVDYVAQFIAEVVTRESLEGKIYHITNPTPPTVGGLEKAYHSCVPYTGVKFIGDKEPKMPDKYMKLFADNLKAYWPYLKPRIVFDKTNAIKVERLTGLEVPRLNEAVLKKLFQFCLKTNFGKKLRTSASSAAASHK